VRCGLGLTVLPRSLLGPGMAVMSMADGRPLPSLPPARLLASFAPGAISPAARRFVALTGEAMAARAPAP
jgi:hypothetical protein